jgi:hypothetical protein
MDNVVVTNTATFDAATTHPTVTNPAVLVNVAVVDNTFMLVTCLQHAEVDHNG